GELLNDMRHQVGEVGVRGLEASGRFFEPLDQRPVVVGRETAGLAEGFEIDRESCQQFAVVIAEFGILELAAELPQEFDGLIVHGPESIHSAGRTEWSTSAASSRTRPSRRPAPWCEFRREGSKEPGRWPTR